MRGRHARSTDAGADFEPTVLVGDGWLAHLSCDTGVVAVAWEETTAAPKAPEAALAGTLRRLALAA